MATDSIDSYGEKGLLHRIHMGENGIYTDEEQGEDKDVKSTYIITDFNQINELYDMFPDLYVPTYVPDGYEFKSLEINVYNSGDYVGEYSFEGNSIKIHFVSLKDNDTRYFSGMDINDLILDDRIIHLSYNKTANQYVAEVYFDTTVVEISGNISVDEMIDMSKNLTKVPTY